MVHIPIPSGGRGEWPTRLAVALLVVAAWLLVWRCCSSGVAGRIAGVTVWLGGWQGAAAGGGGQSDGRQGSGRLGKDSTAELPAMGGSESDEDVQTSEAVGEQSLSDESPSEELSDDGENNRTEKYVCVKQVAITYG